MLKSLCTRLLPKTRSTILTKKNNNPLVENTKLLNVPEKNFCSSPSESGSVFSLLNAKRVIKNSGYELEDGFSCLKTVCPACPLEKEPRETIFINKITGNFTCPACQHRGTWSSLEKFYITVKTPRTGRDMARITENFVTSKMEKMDICFPEDLKTIQELDVIRLRDILDDIGLPQGVDVVLLNQNARISEDFTEIVLPLKDTLDNMVGYKSLKLENYSEKTFPNVSCSGLLIHKPTSVHANRKEPQNAILVLNILDFLTLATSKLNYVIICLPYGLKSLPQECLPGLDKFQKLILWFNHDSAGWDTAKHFAKKLDEKRCLFVRPTEAQPAPFRAHSLGIDLKGVLHKAEPVLHKAITTFSALRQDVLSDLQNIDKVQGVKWKRYPTLSKLLKGHRKGELTVLTGPTGCGKTTFMSEYSLDLALQGVTTLWGSFEIRNTRLAATLLRQLAGQRLDDNLSSFDMWADAFEKLPIYFMTFHGQQPIKVVMEAIEHAQYVHDIQHVIIDNVQFMMGTAEQEGRNVDRFWRQDAIIAAFRTFATRKNSHVTLVIHPRKERDAEDLTTSSIFGSAKASQEADNVLIIQDKRLTSLRGKKYLQVAKNRYSGDLGVMPLDFDKEALSYAQKKKKTTEEKDPTEAVRD